MGHTQYQNAALTKTLSTPSRGGCNKEPHNMKYATKPGTAPAERKKGPTPQQVEARQLLAHVSKRIAALDARLGAGVGARRERERLARQQQEAEAILQFRKEAVA
jgi:hypothetical protein